jgi:hypothetical protein
VTPEGAATSAEPEGTRNRQTEVFDTFELEMGAREAGRMSACAKEPNRQTEFFHIQAS